MVTDVTTSTRVFAEANITLRKYHFTAKQSLYQESRSLSVRKPVNASHCMSRTKEKVT